MNTQRPTDRLVRITLMISVPFNLIVAWMLLFPASTLGALMQLPTPVPPLYAALSAMFVAAFGVLYAWMSVQATINREMLGFVSLCKTSAFIVAQTLWLLGLGGGTAALAAVGDIVLAVIWMHWLLTTRQAA
ncbi:MAG: hypothetical protein M3O62_00160 [Pseudomonadota bacterium]|nr:hypothetical protein [Pseudomonadota bacterium]